MDNKTNQTTRSSSTPMKSTNKKSSKKPTTTKTTATKTTTARSGVDELDLFVRQAHEADAIAGRVEGGPALVGTVITPDEQRRDAIEGCKEILKFFTYAMSFVGVDYPDEFYEQGAEKLARVLEQPYIKKYIGNSVGAVGRSSPEFEALMFFSPYAVMTYAVLTAQPADGQSSKEKKDNSQTKKTPVKLKTGFEGS